MKSRLINLMLRIERAYHLVDAYLAAQREDWPAYYHARIKAGNLKFKIMWG